MWYHISGMINSLIERANSKQQEVKNVGAVQPDLPSWCYDFVTEEEFERRKDLVEEIVISLGGEPVDIKLPYKDRITTIRGEFATERFSERRLFKFTDGYYRVSEVFFDKPFIVFEYAPELDDVLKNIMEDLDPFPYDLPDEEIIMEVKYALGLEKPTC